MDKIFKNNAYRILELFIEHPLTDYSARGIARDLKLNHATVLTYLKDLEKLELINKNKKTLYPTYHAATANQKYIFYKRQHIISLLKDSGLVEYLKEKTFASCIILFGSCAKGAFWENSDIDIFIEAEYQNLDLTGYERFLKKDINLLFEPDTATISTGLKNNLFNGIILSGFIRLKK